MSKRVAVIGAGIVGLAAAWALERRGIACLVFEQGAPGGAQSGGESRIFRHGHSDRRQFELAVSARQGWREWEREFGLELISSDGAMVIGDEAVARLGQYEGESGVRIRELDRDRIREALPILADYEGPALIDESAGAIRTQLTIANLVTSVGLNLVPERIESVRPREGGGVTVISNTGERVFDAVVVAAGAGTASLALTSGIEIPSTPQAHMRLTLPIKSGIWAPRLACLQDSSGTFGEAAAYGSPVQGNREYAVGLALSTTVDPSGDGDPLSGLADRTADYVGRAMPGLDRGGAVSFQRWVTELPWAADGLAIWQRGEAFFIAGHNLFKLAPALGNALADCVEEGEVGRYFRPEDRLGEAMLEAR